LNARAPHTGLRITTILVTMVVGTVAIILLCCILLFLDRYRSAMVQSARTSSSQAVSQVSNTVGSYLRDMGQAMELVEQSVSESGESRDWLLAAFLKYRPDVVAVTSYSAGGELLDAVYLQQNSFDPIDAACEPERQAHEFNVLYDVLTRDYALSDKKEIRAFFNQVRQEFLDWHGTVYGTPEFAAQETKLTDLYRSKVTG